jgi:hypothetical protein
MISGAVRYGGLHSAGLFEEAFQPLPYVARLPLAQVREHLGNWGSTRKRRDRGLVLDLLADIIDRHP